MGSRVTSSRPAKSRAIAIPVDLDSQVNNLFLKSHNIVQKTALNWRLSARNAARRDSVLAASRDYRNIIERLQVRPPALRAHPLVLRAHPPAPRVRPPEAGPAHARLRGRGIGLAGARVSAGRGESRQKLPTAMVFKGYS